MGTTPVTDMLFVYGTLMAAAGDAMGRVERTRLARESIPLGIATTRGLLYDLGRYPGLVVGAAQDGVVEGELVRLSDPARSLGWLDRYEGIVPDQLDKNEYRRAEIDVTIAEGRIVRAAAYVYTRELDQARLVASGSWLRRVVRT